MTEIACEDPITFQEARKKEHWRNAMQPEIESIEANNTRKLVTLSVCDKTVGVKWIYKTKLNEKGDIDKFKAR